MPDLVILAGGASSRMGRDKLLLRGDNGCLLVRQWFDRLGWPGTPRLVLPPGAAPPDELADWPVDHDTAAGEGPLRGVAAALAAVTETPWRLIVPVDMPGLGRAQLDWMTGRVATDPSARLWMWKRGDAIEPFPMLVHTDSRADVDRRLAEGRRSLQGLTALRSVRVVAAPGDWDERVWQNLNRPADLDAYLKDE